MTDHDEIEPARTPLPRWVVWLIAGMFSISLGSSAAAIVTVVRSSGEHQRTCDAISTSIHGVLDGVFFKIPQRSSLPPRTPQEDAERKKALDAINAGINHELAKC